jgi:hypothetical protein
MKLCAFSLIHTGKGLSESSSYTRFMLACLLCDISAVREVYPSALREVASKASFIGSWFSNLNDAYQISKWRSPVESDWNTNNTGLLAHWVPQTTFAQNFHK